MCIRLVETGAESNILANFIVEALTNRVKQTAPGSCWEVEIGHVLCQALCIDTCLNCWAEHNIVGNVVVSTFIFWELKENWLVHHIEGIISITHLRHLSIVISDQRILSLNGISHQVSVSCLAIENCSVESPWLLSISPACSVIS